MIFRRFTLRIIVLILFITLSGMLVMWSFNKPGLAVARFSFIAIWILFIVALIAYVNRTNRTLRIFLDSLKYMDTVRRSPGKGKTFEELDRLYHEITGILHQGEVDRETDRQYFRYLIDHTGVGIVSFNETGDIEMINSAASKLLKLRQPKNIAAFSSLSPELPAILTMLKPGGRKLIKLNIGHEVVGLSVRLARYRISGRMIRLVSFQNIHNELEEEELDAWQKLIRVLTHEIVNSVTPINSLTNTLIRMLEIEGRPKDAIEVDTEMISHLLEGLHSIEKRNRGLVGFVQSYRSLTRIQKPVFIKVAVEPLFLNIIRLVKEEIEQSGISLFISVNPPSLAIDADEKLLEQVLINLINNARDALKETKSPEIRMTGKIMGDQTVIEVQDNGSGIPEEIIGNVFIPFFTTRENGSGIGLSLSRQIMRLHGGTISATSVPGKKTLFTLKVPV